MKTAIHVGASKAAIAEARRAINDILGSGQDQTTQQKALRCLATLCEVKNTNISNNTISHYENGK